MKTTTVRRYVSAAKAEALRQSPAAEYTATGAVTFDIVTLGRTEWYIVPDDDPRLDTIEDVPTDTTEP